MHGNCKLKNAHIFHYTPVSTIEEVDELVTKMTGDAAYKTLVARNGVDGAPRNASQCQYRRQKFLNSQKICRDEIQSVTLLSYELHGFFKSFQIQPHLIIVLMHDQMKQEFLNLLKVSKQKIPLYYDTTFSLGDTYVSVRTFGFSTKAKTFECFLFSDTCLPAFNVFRTTSTSSCSSHA